MLAGLAAALLFGVGDFVGGLASRRIAAVRVVAVSATIGTVILFPLALLGVGEWSPQAVALGAASGIANSMAILLLYAALAIGPMSILSPLTAVLAAAVPVLFGALDGDLLSPLAWIGIVLALIAVVVVGLAKGRGVSHPSVRGLLYSAASGLLIGMTIITLDRTPADSGVVPLLFNRAASAAILTTIVVVLAARAARRGTPMTAGWRAGIAITPVCGVIDVVANSLTLVALRAGELGITSVVVGLYPAATVALAAVVLRERLSATQWAGLGLALAAAALLALA